MTVESTLTKKIYQANGDAREWPVPFAYSRAEDIRLMHTDAEGIETEIADNFRVNVNESGDTNVTYPVTGLPLPAGVRVTVHRETPRTQVVDLVHGGDFNPEVLEHDGFDRLEMQIQELQEQTDRAVKVAISSAETPEELAAELFTARDVASTAAARACACRDEACECAEEAAESLDQIQRLWGDAVTDIGNAAQQGLESITTEGQTQVNRVAAEGAFWVNQAHNEADRAYNEANRATNLAEDLYNITGFGPATRTKLGMVRIGDGISVTEDGTISIRFPVVVSTPAVTFPAIVGIGYEYEATFSAETGAPQGVIDFFEVYVDDNPAVRVPATDGRASLMVTPTGVGGTIGRMIVIAVDTYENAGLSATVTFVKNTIAVHAPAVISPAAGAAHVGLTPTIQIQEAGISGITSSPEATHIQVATDAAFTHIVAERLPENGYTTIYTTPQLIPETVYYIRAKHAYPMYGWSSWGNVSSFTTMAVVLSVPVITSPAHNAVDVLLAGPITLQDFTVVGQTHQYMQIQISTSPDFTTVEYDSGSVAPALTHTLAAAMPKNAIRYVRARNYGSISGWTQWSAVVEFTTAPIAVNETIALPHGDWIVPVAGKWKLEVAGAAGSNCSTGAYHRSCGNCIPPTDVYFSSYHYGGAGGYAKIDSQALAKNETMKITVSGSASIGTLVSATGGSNGYCCISYGQCWGPGFPVDCIHGDCGWNGSPGSPNPSNTGAAYAKATFLGT